MVIVVPTTTGDGVRSTLLFFRWVETTNQVPKMKLVFPPSICRCYPVSFREGGYSIFLFGGPGLEEIEDDARISY